jgi:peptidoglycan/LPS O-acetylase OafA/YrhL
MFLLGITVTVLVSVFTSVTWIMGSTAVMFMILAHMCAETRKPKREERRLRAFATIGACLMLIVISAALHDLSLFLRYGWPMLIGMIYPGIWYHFFPLDADLPVDTNPHADFVVE